MKREGFSLLELILVMAILTSIFAITVPSLGRFFRGQSIEEETRRFLTLTRYAPNLAISSNIPMILWVDEMNNTYGIRPQNGLVCWIGNCLQGGRSGRDECFPTDWFSKQDSGGNLSKYTSGLMSAADAPVTQCCFCRMELWNRKGRRFSGFS